MSIERNNGISGASGVGASGGINPGTGVNTATKVKVDSIMKALTDNLSGSFITTGATKDISSALLEKAA